MSRRSLSILCAVILLAAALVAPRAASAALRSLPEQIGKTGLQDTTPGLKGDVTALKQALSRSTHVNYKLLIIDDTDGEDRTAYLDRILDAWGWPAHDTLLLIVYTAANHDIRFAMGSDFRSKWQVSVDEMLVLLREVYFKELHRGDPARALAALVETVNRRVQPKLAALSLNTDTPKRHDEVVRAFYQWYFEYIGPANQPPKANVQADRAYRTSPYLTQDFVKRVDQALAEMDKSAGGYDLFLCMQNRPDDVDLFVTNEQGDRATTTMRTFLGFNQPRHVQIELVRTEGRWLIDGVRCQTP